MEVEMIQMLSETGEKQYPVTSSEAVGMSDGSGNLDAKLAELENSKSKDGVYAIIRAGFFNNNFFTIKNCYFANDGTLINASESFICTPYIPFKKGDELIATGTTKGAAYDNCCFYNKELEYISGINLASSITELKINSSNTPEETEYITLNGLVSSEPKASITIKTGGFLAKIDKNTNEISEIDKTLTSLTPFIEKNAGILKNDGTIDYSVYPNSYHTNFIAVSKGDKITINERVNYGNGTSGTILLFNEEKSFINYFTPGSSTSFPYIYTVTEGTSFAVVNSISMDTDLPLLNGSSLGIKESIEELKKKSINIDNNSNEINTINLAIESLSYLIEKNAGTLKDDGTIDYIENRYHTKVIEVNPSDKITYYSRVSYGNDTAGTIVLIDRDKRITGHFTPGSIVSLPSVYTVSEGTAYIVVNGYEDDESLPLINGKSIEILKAISNNEENINLIKDDINNIYSESESLQSVFTTHNKSLSKTLGEYRSDTGYSISYPIPCKSGDVFSMSGFSAGAIANAWLLNDELLPIYVLAASSNQILDNKWNNIKIPSVSGETVAYIVACRRDNIDPDNFFILNGFPIPPLQYIEYLKESGLPSGISLISDINGVNEIALIAPDGNAVGIKASIGGLSVNKKYNGIGDSVTQASNLGTVHSNDYVSLISKSKGYIYNQNETNRSDMFWIKIENNKEGSLVTADDSITPIWTNKFGQGNNIMWGTDTDGNYYRRLYQNAFGGKAAYGECSIACNDVRYYNPDVISILIGANDATGIDSPNNPYKLGTINDVPVGVINFYLLDRIYSKEEVAGAINNIDDRKIGMRVFYKKDDTSTNEIYYIGETINDDDWNNQDNWVYWYTLSFYSFYKGCVENVLTNNMSADVVLMNYLQHVKDYGETTIGKVMNAIKEVADTYKVRFVDITHNSGVNSHNYYAYFNEGEVIDGWVDNIHPNSAGHKRMAEICNRCLG